MRESWLLFPAGIESCSLDSYLGRRQLSRASSFYPFRGNSQLVPFQFMYE
jgi:hypothetical protein